MDLALRGATMVTMRGDRPTVERDHTLGVRDGELAYVGPDEAFDADPDRVVDASDRVAMPGLVDAHVHTAHTLLRGGAQDVPEIQWMDRALGPLAAHADDADRVAGARLGVLEGLRSGVTTFGEYAAGVDRLVEDVYEPWGVRVAATETIEGVVDRGDDPEEPYDLDEGAAREALGRADDLAARYPDHPLVEPMYGPQAVDMVPEAVLEDTVALARERDCRVHVHVAQGRRERLQVQARYGDSSIAVLDRRDLLGPELIAVHCHDAAPDELARLARAGATYVGCPSSIAAIDGAVPPMEEFRRRGVPVGFGTDQAPGPGGHDFLRELRTASLLAKVDAGDPTALPAWHAFAAGTVGGARALGIDDEVGTIEEGKRADVVLLDAGEPGLAPAVADPLETLLPNLVYSASRAAVTDVLVDGAFRVRDGEFVAGDEAAVVETARERATALFDRAADDWRAADSDLVGAADAGWL